MKSNITIASNIYIRANNDIQRDIAYVHQITGKKKLRAIKAFCSGTMSSFKLTDWQEAILREDLACAYARNGEATHGVLRVDGNIRYVGRCEYSLCPRFTTCKETAPYKRFLTAPDEIIEDASPALSYEWLGIVSADELFTEKEDAEEESAEIVPEESIIENFKEFVKLEEFTTISEPSVIINAPIDSKILVNAAPGSGKTYTVIERLEHIIGNQMVEDFSGILVLVYTNAAKNEILSRLDSGVAQGVLPYSARNVDVCTFDSLATSYLSAIEAQFTHLDYNGRIRFFNQQFDKENFSNFEYVIVDELQDLVNERAIMTLNILGALTGGYLLLGDKCQAIYDYDCHEGDSVNSVEFYGRLDFLLPEDVVKYELIGNKRQISSLARLSDDMRCALLEFDDPADVNDLMENELNTIQVMGSIERIDFSILNKKTAILCRNNGEAEYVSHLLHKKRVPHILLRGVSQTASLNRWIADCLWDYQAGSRISKESFISRYCSRVSDDKNEAGDHYEILCELVYDATNSFIEIDKLVASLKKSVLKLPEIFINPSDSNITVSTIHKAKGREFDNVYLLDGGFITDDTNTEEARVWYVGCTRAKNELGKLQKKKQYLRKSNTNQKRWAGLGFHQSRWGNNHCSNIVVGLPDDVLASGFVSGKLEDAINTQEYISKSVSVEDELELILTCGVYHVIHKGRVVGSLDSSLYHEFLGIAKENVQRSSPPPYLSPIFVTNIVTVVMDRFPEGVSTYFRNTKFWLGVEISGFPKINWHYENL